MHLSGTHRRLDDLALRRPVTFGMLLVLIWWAIMLLLASALPRFSPSWLTDLRSTLVNVGALLVPLAVVAAFGWWHRAGLSLPRPERSWWSLLPLLAFALSFAAGGLSGSAIQFFSSGVLFLTLGLNEELLYRGVIQHAPTLLVRFVPSCGWRCCSALTRGRRDLLRSIALRYSCADDLRDLLRGGLCSGQAADRHDLALSVLVWAGKFL